MNWRGVNIRLPALIDVGARTFAGLVLVVAGGMILSKADLPRWANLFGEGNDTGVLGLTDYVRFKYVRIGDSEEIVTGLGFRDLASAHDPQNGWCYLARPAAVTGETTERLYLAQQTGSAPPEFITVKEDAARIFGRTAAQVEQLARQHCDFSVPES